MFRLSCKIKIGSFQFTGVNELVIKSSWEELTDTCEIVLPRKLNWEGRNIAAGGDPLLKRGMKVSVELGYDDQLSKVFEGFVKNIFAETPVRIVCEDAMYALKGGEFNASYKSVDLQTLLSDMSEVKPFEFKVLANRELGQLRVSKSTPAKVLEYLRSDYGVKTWFRAGVLYAGLVVDPAQQSTHSLRVELSLIENNLEYRRREDIKIKLEAKVIYGNNQVETINAGDDDGELRTLYYYNIPKVDVQKQIEADIERLKYDGYKGSLVTFGRPFIKHGDVVSLRSSVLPERDGRYLAKSVEYTFGQGGFRQTVELETKV